MTSPQSSLDPASGNDRRALFSTLELVACSHVQQAQVVVAIIGQSMLLEPGPILHGIHVRRARRQECHLNVSGQAVQVRAHQMTAMRLQAIPDDQQWLLQVGFERFEEFDDLFLLDAALVQPEQAVGTRQASDDRDMVPVEVKLDDGCLPLGAQVRTLVGRSLMPDSSTKTISRPCRRA